MDDSHLKCPAGYGKIAIIIFGMVVMGTGLYSHFNSDWRFVNKHTYICEEYEYSVFARSGYKSCPPFAMEEYFVSVIIIFFILSLVSLFYASLVKKPSRLGKRIDAGYHSVAAVMLVIGGALYIASAIQILNTRGIKYYKGEELEYGFGAKMVAGVLTIFQGILYGIVAICISKRDKNEHQPVDAIN